MKQKEFFHILLAILILFCVVAFAPVLKGDWTRVYQSIGFSILFISGTVLTKKIMANSLDADVEHSIWTFSRYWIRPQDHLSVEVPVGILAPLFFCAYSLGSFKIPTILMYETKILKRRVAKRFGFESYLGISDYHIAVIGAAGIMFALLFSIILYFLPYDLEYFAIISTAYAFFNMLPISKLDGAQIFFGSRRIYLALAILVLIFTLYAGGAAL